MCNKFLVGLDGCCLLFSVRRTRPKIEQLTRERCAGRVTANMELTDPCGPNMKNARGYCVFSDLLSGAFLSVVLAWRVARSGATVFFVKHVDPFLGGLMGATVVLLMSMCTWRSELVPPTVQNRSYRWGADQRDAER